MNAISTSFDTSSDDAIKELQLWILTSLLVPEAFQGKSIVVSLGSPAINPIKKHYRQTRCDAAYTRNDSLVPTVSEGSKTGQIYSFDAFTATTSQHDH